MQTFHPLKCDLIRNKNNGFSNINCLIKKKISAKLEQDKELGKCHGNKKKKFKNNNIRGI